MPPVANGSAIEASTPMSEKLSGSATLSAIQFRSIGASSRGTADSGQTIESSLSVRQMAENVCWARAQSGAGIVAGSRHTAKTSGSSVNESRRWFSNAIFSGRNGPPAAATLGVAHLQLVHAEIVRDLVPDGFFHELFQVRGAARQAFVRPLEDGDAVGHAEALEDTAAGERAALVEA